MNYSEYYRLYKKLQHHSPDNNKESSPFLGMKNILITVQNKKNKVRKKIICKQEDYRQPTVVFHLSNFGSSKNRKHVSKQASMPKMNTKNELQKLIKPQTKSLIAISQTTISLYNRKYLLTEHCLIHKLKPFTNIKQPAIKVYRCQLTSNVAENCNSCCCSCNSDTMFEVMKDLYDCYKKKNCDNCNCILCCNSPNEKRLGDAGKPETNLETALKEVAMRGFALPEGKTESEKKVISKIRKVLGLPPEPTSQPMRDKHTNAANAGFMAPLEGKSTKQKEKILLDLHRLGIPLPVGRTPSEQVLIDKIRGKELAHSEKVFKSFQKNKHTGLLTNFEGKSSHKGDSVTCKCISPRTSDLRDKYAKAAEEQGRVKPLPEGLTPSEEALIAKILQEKRNLSPKEKKLRELAMKGIPLPEAKTDSDKQLLKKVRAKLGLPPEPKTPGMREKHNKAADMGLLLPLEGKSLKEKERILRGLAELGIPLPKGRTPSEESLIAIVKGEPRDSSMLEQLKKESKITLSLEGRTPDEVEKKLRKIAMRGIPLPEGQTASQNKLIKKVRVDLGLPPEPKTPTLKEKHKKAAEEGLLYPLEGKSPEEKEIIIQGLLDMDIPLPNGRTTSEKALIAKVRERHKLNKKTDSNLKESEGPVDKCICGILAPPMLITLDMKRRAKAAEKRLEGKTPDEKNKILRALAKEGIPLPKGKTTSEKKLITKVRTDLGLPPEPTTVAMRDKHEKAAVKNLLLPLEGQSPEEKERILRGLHDLGIPLPKARSPSEKSLIIRIQGKRPTLTPSEKMRGAKAAGLLTPLRGKTPAQKQNILRGLAEHGIPLPEGETASEKKIINKVRLDLGLPPEPKTLSMRDKYAKAADAGILQPLEGKTPKEKEKNLRKYVEVGIPLPKPRTASEKKLISKIKGEPRVLSRLTPSEKIHKTQSAGLLTPLKEKGPSEIGRVLKEEGKRKDVVAGLLTPLDDKTPEQKEKILRKRVAAGLPLPEGKSPSEKDLVNKIKASTAYATPSPSEVLRKAEAVGLLPFKGSKTPSEKEKTLRKMAAAGIPLPEGKTPSEKELINRIKTLQKSKSDKIRAAKAAGLLTPLNGKTPVQKEKILRKLAENGLPLPEGRTTSEKKLIDKIRAETGLPPTPKTLSMREKYKRGQDAGIITPLKDKSLSDKEKILRRLHEEGIPLPAGRTPSEKNLIKRIKAGFPASKPPFEEMTPDKKEKILRSIIKSGRSLPDAKTPSGIDMIKKVRRDMGLPPEPTTASMKEKMGKAYTAGLITPLEGKTPSQKEKILRGLAEAGIPLPEGRTSSEKAIKRKIEDETKKKLERQTTKPITKEKRVSKGSGEAVPKIESKKIKRAEELGLTTPLAGKSPKEKERVLRGLAKEGLPLPEGTTRSDKQLIKSVRKDLGLPPDPETPSMKKRHFKAANASVLVPLEGLTQPEKEQVLRSQAKMGLNLPEGRTPSEKLLINKIKEEAALSKVPSEKLEKAKNDGLLTPLKGKSPSEKEKIIRGRAKAGLPLPEGRTMSEKALIKKTKSEFRRPPISKEAVQKAREKGLLTPLTGKTSAEKEKILHGLAEAGIPLPEGETSKDRALIRKVKEAHKEAKEKGSETNVLESKITKCERACGCDKKKIRFKHSYVKIKVTSPDISSLCPCPDECIPGVKGGVFVDNQGVNVIIESAVGISQYRRNENEYSQINILKPVPIHYDIHYRNRNLINSIYEEINLTKLSTHSESLLDIPLIHIPLPDERFDKNKQWAENLITYNKSYSIREVKNHGIYLSRHYGEPDLLTSLNYHSVTENSSQDSFDSIKIIKSETSLGFSSSYEEVTSCSVLSIAAIAPTSNSNACLLSLSKVDFNNIAVVESEFLTNGLECCVINTNTSSGFCIESQESTDRNILIKRNQMPDDPDDDSQVFPMSSSNSSSVYETKLNSDCSDNIGESVIIITNLNSNLDLTSVVDDLITKKEFGDASSLFVVVPTSDEEENEIRDLGSSQCVQLSENCNKWKNAEDAESCTACKRPSSKTQDLRKTEKNNLFLKNLPTTILSSLHNRKTMYNYANNNQTWLPSKKICQKTPTTIFHGHQGVSTDTTQDRPCCCGETSACANIMSEVITPVYINRGLESDTLLEHRNKTIQQKSFVSVIHSPALSVNRISEFHRHPDYQSPEQVVPYPFDTPTPQQLKYFKKLLQRNLSHHTMNKILREIDAGNLDLSSLDESNGSPSEFSPEESVTNSPINEHYFICHQQKVKKLKLPKWVVKNSKMVRIDDGVCTCEHRPPSLTKTETESKTPNENFDGQLYKEFPKSKKLTTVSKLNQKVTAPIVTPHTLVSIGVQDSPGCILCLSGLPCTSEHNIPGPVTSLSNVMSYRTPVNIYGHYNKQNVLNPLRSYAAIGSGGTYSQRSSTHSHHRTNAGVGKDLKNVSTDKYRSEHSNKRIQKNNKVSYDYPPPEPELKPKHYPRHMPQNHERKENNIILMKPNLTQTTSRVQFDESSFVKPPAQPSWTIEDLIRYYASFKPEVLKTLLSLTSIKIPDEKNVTHNREIPIDRYVRGGIKGENSAYTNLPESSYIPVKEEREQESRPFTGFKFKKPGCNADDTLIPKKDITQQASFLLNSTISRCEISPCDTRTSCHTPEEILQYPFGTPLSEPLEKLKKLVQLNCSPEKVKYFFEQVEAGNINDVDYESAMKTKDPNIAESVTLPEIDLSCELPPCKRQPGCHALDEVYQYPFGTPLPPNLVKLKELLEQNYSPKKVRLLFEQIEAGKLKNIDWEDAKKIPTDSFNNPCTSLRLEPTPTDSLSDLMELINLIEQKNCTEEVKNLFAQIKNGNSKNDNFNGATKPPTNCPSRIHPPSISLPISKTNCPRRQSKDRILPVGSPIFSELLKVKERKKQDDMNELIDLFREIEADDKSQKLVAAVNLLSDEQPSTKSGQPLSLSKPSAMTCRFKHYQQLLDSSHETSQPALKTCLPQYRYKISTFLEENNNSKTNDSLFLRNQSTDFPINNSPISKSVSNSATCVLSSCHLPDEVLQYPHGTPLPPNLLRLKELLEKNSDPKRVKKLFQRIEAGDLCYLDCEEAFRECINIEPPDYSNSRVTCPGPPCKQTSSCHLPDEVLQYPYGTPLPQALANLKKVLEQNHNPKKVKDLYKQIEAGDLCNLDWKGALEIPTEPYAEECSTSRVKRCQNTNCDKNRVYRPPDEDLKYPSSDSLTQSLENLRKLIEQNTNLFRQLQDKDDLCNLECEEDSGIPTETCYAKRSTSDVKPCQNPCSEKNLYSTVLSQSLENLKRIIQRNSNFFRQLHDEELQDETLQNEDNLCNLDWENETDTNKNLDNNENLQVISCRPPSCQINTSCHLAGELIQYPYGTPLPLQLVKLKTFLEQNSNPKEVKELFGQIEAGNLKNLDLASNRPTRDFLTDKCPNSELISPTISTCRIPTCSTGGYSHCHSPDDLLWYPFGTPLPKHLEKLKQMLEQNISPAKVKELFSQLEEGNFKDLDWNGGVDTRRSCQPTCQGHQDSNLLTKTCAETPLPPHLVQLKKVLQEKCSPEMVKELIKQIKACNVKNMKSVACGESLAITPDVSPPLVSTVTDQTPSQGPETSMVLKPGAFPPGATPLVFPPGAIKLGVLPPKVFPEPKIPIVLPPEVYAPAPKNEDCATCHKPKYRDGIKMKCVCSGKKKKVKIKPCPCEVHKVPISKDEPGLKIETHSQGAQCCVCDEYFARVKKSGKDTIFKLGQSAPSIIGTPGGPVSTGIQGGAGCIICPTGLPCSSEDTTCPKLSTITISPIPLGYYGQPNANAEMGELEIIGPQGGYVTIGPDGIYTQSGIKVIKFSTGNGTDPDSENVGAESSSKKRKNCLCSGKRGKKKRKVVCQCPSESDLEPLLLYTYEDYEEARKQSRHYKSDLTQTTSGFKFDKKKRPKPDPVAEYTVEDAIRDYAIIKPEFIRSLVPPGVRRKHKVNCVCEEDVGVGKYEILKVNKKGVVEIEKPEPVQQDVPVKGLKFSIGGKGSGSKGLSGICCFEMYQDL